ncbi:MAG: hypothetical protein SFU27_05945 [Thermonemataceae bacterium]|nr:hypothetical protein [Thermonemataceae bacterium]
MQQEIKNLAKVLFPTSFLALVFLVDDFVLKQPFLHEYKWYLLLFFWVQTLLTTFITTQGLSRDAKYFQNFFFVTMLLRMFLGIIVVFYAVYQGVINPLLFVITFFLIYFSFVSFEIYALLHNLRSNKNKEQNH